MTVSMMVSMMVVVVVSETKAVAIAGGRGDESWWRGLESRVGNTFAFGECIQCTVDF